MAEHPTSLECVVNVSEGRDTRVLQQLAEAGGQALLDLHCDPDHHRSVLTLGGPAELVEPATRTLAAATVALLDLTDHAGRHPRIGVLDVVPFVPLPAGLLAAGPLDPGAADLRSAVAARDRFVGWAGAELSLPCFSYGPLPGGEQRTLPEVRREAFRSLAPDGGPSHPHPTAGACAVGARPVLVAYNIWMDGGSLELARSVASAIRGPAVRALGLDLSGTFQVSCNLIDPLRIGPAEIHDSVAALLRDRGASAARCELVGLVPAAVLAAVPSSRWPALDLRAEDTIEARLEQRELPR